MRISVAIVEDQSQLREELAALVGSAADLQLAGVFATGEDAVREVPALASTVVVMDLHLPGISGIESTRLIKKALPDTQVLILTMFDDAERIFGALRAGASGYLLKRSASGGLVEAIKQVAEGGSPVSPQIARKVFQFFREQQAAPSAEDNLTDRERELLGLLARGRQYKEIADHLGISTDTVRSHIRRIYKKLHVHTRTEATLKYLGENRA